jgi:RNA polymerase sigma factor for flagellar operon FliA
MTLSLPQSQPVSLADTLSVVDAVLGAIDRRIPAHVSRDDLASAGKLALIEALLRFAGPPDQVRAYCYVRVRGAVFDELRRLDPLSRHTRTQVTLVRRAAAALEREFGRAPLVSELAAVTGFSVDAVAQLERLATAAQVCSADDTTVVGEQLHTLVDNEATCPARSAESGDAHASVRAALDRLPANHARVLRRYYLEDATLDDIGAEMDISKERVRQIREAAEKNSAPTSSSWPCGKAFSPPAELIHPISILIIIAHPMSLKTPLVGRVRRPLLLTSVFLRSHELFHHHISPAHLVPQNRRVRSGAAGTRSVAQAARSR